MTQICFSNDGANSTNHMESFQFRFVPLSYVVLNLIQIICFAIRSQSEVISEFKTSSVTSLSYCLHIILLGSAADHTIIKHIIPYFMFSVFTTV